MWGKTVWNAIIPAIGPEQLKDTQARLQIYKEAEINSKIKPAQISGRGIFLNICQFNQQTSSYSSLIFWKENKTFKLAYLTP